MERGADPLHHALAEIAAIRGQMARAGEFRGYGPATLAATSLLAVAAGFIQPLWVAQPLALPGQYVAFWCAVAAVAAALIAGEALARSRRLHGGLADAMIRAALEQFLPAALAGTLLTAALMRWAPETVRLLPGLWQLVFSLGVFATCRFLPRAVLAVGGWYLVTGLGAIALSARHGLDPWIMAAPFAVGQAMAAAILWRWSETQ